MWCRTLSRPSLEPVHTLRAARQVRLSTASKMHPAIQTAAARASRGSQQLTLLLPQGSAPGSCWLQEPLAGSGSGAREEDRGCPQRGPGSEQPKQRCAELSLLIRSLNKPPGAGSSCALFPSRSALEKHPSEKMCLDQRGEEKLREHACAFLQPACPEQRC